jgi:hypothetical protein
MQIPKATIDRIPIKVVAMTAASHQGLQSRRLFVARVGNRALASLAIAGSRTDRHFR